MSPHTLLHSIACSYTPWHNLTNLHSLTHPCTILHSLTRSDTPSHTLHTHSLHNTPSHNFTLTLTPACMPSEAWAASGSLSKCQHQLLHLNHIPSLLSIPRSSLFCLRSNARLWHKVGVWCVNSAESGDCGVLVTRVQMAALPSRVGPA